MKKRTPVEWMALSQVSMTKEFAERLADAPLETLDEKTLRANEKLMGFLVKQGINDSLSFEVTSMTGSSWLYVVQRWRQ